MQRPVCALALMPCFELVSLAYIQQNIPVFVPVQLIFVLLFATLQVSRVGFQFEAYGQPVGTHLQWQNRRMSLSHSVSPKWHAQHRLILL